MSEITIPYEPSTTFDPSKYVSKENQWVIKAQTPNYVVVKRRTSLELEGLVNKYLEQGYDLVGGVSHSADEYCQAMIKRW